MIKVYFTKHALARLFERYGLAIEKEEQETITEAIANDFENWPEGITEQGLELYVKKQRMYVVLQRSKNQSFAWAIVTIHADSYNRKKALKKKQEELNQTTRKWYNEQIMAAKQKKKRVGSYGFKFM